MRAYISSLHKLAWTGYALALIVCSLAPVDLSGAPEHGDKLLHFLAYCLLVLFWPPAWSGILGRFAMASALGLGLEVAQQPVPLRRARDRLVQVRGKGQKAVADAAAVASLPMRG